MAYRRTVRVQARLDAARGRIVDATLALVAEDGWGAATVAAIAQRSEVATGTVYRHFEDKDALFSHAFRRAAGRELAHVAAVCERDGSPTGRLEAALRTFAHRALSGRRLAYALLAEPAGTAVESERLTYRTGYRDVFRELLGEAAAVGELVPHDVEVVAAVLTGAMGEALVGPLSPVAAAPARSRAEQQVDTVVAACLRALPTRRSQPAEEGQP